MKKNTLFIVWMFLLASTYTQASHQPEFSTAGFFQLDKTGREVFSMNPAWRIYKGPAEGAEHNNFNDQHWQVVSLPNGIDYLPTEASGCINYQGEVWYRKHFMPAAELQGRKLFLHFEGIMGKSKIFVNGKLLSEHFSGYLPAIVDVSQALKWGEDNIIAVWADNSDDPNYPPGKPQDVLDFTYFGGIYRDCWLIAHNQVFITDPNYEQVTAGGGLFVAFDRVSDRSADILLQTHVRNDSRNGFSGSVEYELLQDGQQVALLKKAISVRSQKATTVKEKLILKEPHLWSPESPELYDLLVRIYDKQRNVVDGYRRRIGVRSIEFKGPDGFWLNGKPYESPLIGANRHQDFAVVGNAVANSIHWRDAKKLRDAGLKVVRNAHCPQDPAFMDACDELGLFVIVNTPGWQFWNDAPVFAERVFSDIRNLVRRDRNHACVWMWEPILNETWYPADFAQKTRLVVDEEYPYPSCYSGSDSSARGNEYFSIHFAHPSNSDAEWAIKDLDPNRTYFTREWGDNVDDWSSHNSPSRVARNWGEEAMLIQTRHYAKPDYDYTSYDGLYRTSRQHMGGCLWHSFDHQRGYHPDPFYGGIMDVFRQPKYSYHMFQAQRSATKEERLFETGPMIYIAHAMTPFSNQDVTVYSNCDEVRLTFCKEGKTHSYTRPANQKGMPSPPIVFKDVYNFMVDKAMSRDKKQSDVFLLAEGIIDGKVVATHKVSPARRPSKLMLWIDNEGTELQADGSDFVTVVAAITDENGNIKRLNNDYIKFHVEGEGRLLGGADVLANPAPVRWGTAPILVQSTLTPGEIKITASVLFEGSQKAIGAELMLKSVSPTHPMIYSSDEVALLTSGDGEWILPTGYQKTTDLRKERERSIENAAKLKEVEQQQTDFGEQR